MAITINGLSNAYPPAGKNTGEVSNTILNGVLITPSGYAFAIWGLIYIGLIAYSFYQVLPAQRQDPTLAQIAWAIIGACVFQMAWLYVFLTYQFWLSVVFMLGILACLAFAYVRSRSAHPTRQVRWLLQAPISVYFGWITVATVVNVAGAIYVLAIPTDRVETFSGVITASSGGLIVTAIMMGVSAGLAAFVGLKYHDAAYPAVVVWALSAIAIRHMATLLPIALVGVVLALGLVAIIVRILTRILTPKRPLNE
jgi:TspO/MBR family